jgi:hypothetical protein
MLNASRNSNREINTKRAWEQNYESGRESSAQIWLYWIWPRCLKEIQRSCKESAPLYL